ncbi:unnamed protein product [Ranitomeya imitator]|uniref:Helicase-associated domain-containing protein n=1 Tax=Ranitomeya imitator TaxID=111125 RepID=A0ABN9KU37_9NEOB|nr:unnamed protein product [Ranitomeya imitator]
MPLSGLRKLILSRGKEELDVYAQAFVSTCAAQHALNELDALDANDELTPLGRILAKLPIEPRLGKMMIMGCTFFVGDALCTISAATCFQEPFISEGRRLGYVHRNFAGNRFSDHVALLSVFQAWDDARMGGEDAEMRFCEHKRLNMSTLRMTWEAKVQLKDILINAGFPEECLMNQVFNNTGPDNNLDVVISLLAFGVYPNVCYHKEKRKILTTEGRNALIHKSSVNCPFSSQDMKYPSPFFVFGEKIRTRAISAKVMTMVSPLQLLLFGSKKVMSDGQQIILDDWIKLLMCHEDAASITALKSAMEALVVEVTKEPEILSQLDPVNEKMLNMIRILSKPSTAGINLMIANSRGRCLLHLQASELIVNQVSDVGSPTDAELPKFIKFTIFYVACNHFTIANVKD